MNDVVLFISFLRDYFFERILGWTKSFEKLKDLIVALLVVKRGKYSSSFLNTSLFILISIAVIAGPIIAENNPFAPFIEYKPQNAQTSAVSYNPYESQIMTAFSVKPRDKIIDYSVIPGDTLSTIATKFDISTDSIKWANNLKSDTIKQGQILKIPPITGVVHKVVSGDTIYSIAKKYKTTAQNIVNFIFNDFTDPDTFGLQVGQLVYVPDGVIEEEQPKYATTQKQMYAQVQSGVHGSSTFIWPTSGIITQYPIWYHMALDIANNSLPPVLASDTGTVTFAGCIQYGYGCHVVVDHANGYQTLYGHLSAISVTPGQVVSQGQQVGTMGSTGRSTGPHLHFEIRLGGVLQNPQSYLR